MYVCKPHTLVSAPAMLTQICQSMYGHGMHMCVCAHMFECMCTCVHVCVQRCLELSTCRCVYMYAHTLHTQHTHTNTHTYMYTHTYAYTHLKSFIYSSSGMGLLLGGKGQNTQVLNGLKQIWYNGNPNCQLIIQHTMYTTPTHRKWPHLAVDLQTV